MIQFILMLLGLAFPNNNANTTTISDNNPVTVQAQNGPTKPGSGTGTNSDGGATTGDTGQTPPPYSQP